ncbi:MAG: sugar ABC transporter substrate-binding protein [Deltaproteobacteria bacterium]|nr:sugar ABC transporter substrate-binding protein [Deltaproteobacteria bacterium]
MWAMGREGEVVERLLPELYRRHPEIQVRVQQIPWSAAHEKLLTAFVGDSMPDVFQLGNTWLPELVALGAVGAIEPQVMDGLDLDDYFPGILDTNRIDGSLWALPWYVDTRLLFYRSDLLAEAGYTNPPRSWDAWMEMMHAIKQHGGSDHYAAFLPLREWQTPVILALQRGAELLREHDQHGNFEGEPFRAAFNFYVELFRRGLAPASGDSQVANVYSDFAAGYFTFYVTGPWNLGELQARLPAGLNDRWTTAPMPSPNDTYPGISLAGGSSLAVFRGTRHEASARQLIAFLSEPAQQVEFYRLTGDLPARRTAWESDALRQNTRAQAFREQLQALRSTPKIPEWERIADKIMLYAERAVRGDLTVDAALAALDADVEVILEKRRWLLRRRDEG